MANNELFDLFSETDGLIKNYLRPKEWQGTLPMQCCRIIHRDEPLLTDLFEFCRDGMKSTLYRNLLIRFDTTIYPISEDGSNYFGKGSWGHKLITELLRICHRNGRSTYCSDGSCNNKNIRRIGCHYFFRHISKYKEEKSFLDLALRKGKSKSTAATSKRTLSGRAKCNEEKCGSFFTINVDSRSFYMTIGNGIGKHSNHAPHELDSVVLPKRLIPDDIRNSIKEFAYFKASKQSIINMAINQFDCTLSRRQVTDVAGFAAIATSMQEARLITGGKMSDPDQMINYFTKMDIPHIVLSHEKSVELNELPGQSVRNRNKKKIGTNSTGNKENEVNAVLENETKNDKENKVENANSTNTNTVNTNKSNKTNDNEVNANETNDNEVNANDDDVNANETNDDEVNANETNRNKGNKVNAGQCNKKDILL